MGELPVGRGRRGPEPAPVVRQGRGTGRQGVRPAAAVGDAGVQGDDERAGSGAVVDGERETGGHRPILAGAPAPRTGSRDERAHVLLHEVTVQGHPGQHPGAGRRGHHRPGSVTFPAAHTPGRLVAPPGWTGTNSPIAFVASRRRAGRTPRRGRGTTARRRAPPPRHPHRRRRPGARRVPRSPRGRRPSTTSTPSARNCAAVSGGTSRSCRKNVTRSVSARNSRTWCSELGRDPRTPTCCPRTSYPWQNGQCRTPVPHHRRSPGTSGSSSTRPVASSSRRARTADPPSSPRRNPDPRGRPSRPGRRGTARRTRGPPPGRRPAGRAGRSPRAPTRCARAPRGRCGVPRRPRPRPSAGTGPARPPPPGPPRHPRRRRRPPRARVGGVHRATHTARCARGSSTRSPSSRACSAGASSNPGTAR